MLNIYRFSGLMLSCSLLAWAQNPSPAGHPAQMVVTTGHSYGHQSALLTAADLTVTQHYEAVPITRVVPLRGDRAGIEMFVLVDNCSNCEVNSKVEELRRFISSQPPTTAIGVAYIRDGRVEIGEKPTRDHQRAVNALSPPTGSKPSGPFLALADLIKEWGPDPSRHVVLMMTNGVDPNASDWQPNPSADAAIEAAQRAGVTVYAIYNPSADYMASDFSKLYAGQVQMAHVAAETGGEAYFVSFGPLPSLAPFLADISEHLGNRYLVEFLANPDEAPGGLQEITVRAKTDVELMVPSKVFVPAPAGAGGSR